MTRARPAGRHRGARARPPGPVRWRGVGAAVSAVVAVVSIRSDAVGWVFALAAAAAASWLVRRLAGRSAGGAPDPGLPLALDLAASALRCGCTVADALDAAAPAAGHTAEQLRSVATAVRSGADPAVAWAALAGDPGLGLVARVAVRSAGSGARLAEAFERAADQVRGDAAARAEARAHRVAVLAVGPVGLCHLPAFVCLGVVPVLAGLAHGVFVRSG